MIGYSGEHQSTGFEGNGKPGCPWGLGKTGNQVGHGPWSCWGREYCGRAEMCNGATGSQTSRPHQAEGGPLTPPPHLSACQVRYPPRRGRHHLLALVCRRRLKPRKSPFLDNSAHEHVNTPPKYFLPTVLLDSPLVWLNSATPPWRITICNRLGSFLACFLVCCFCQMLFNHWFFLHTPPGKFVCRVRLSASLSVAANVASPNWTFWG